jgi:hypothetical protein
MDFKQSTGARISAFHRPARANPAFRVPSRPIPGLGAGDVPFDQLESGHATTASICAVVSGAARTVRPRPVFIHCNATRARRVGTGSDRRHKLLPAPQMDGPVHLHRICASGRRLAVHPEEGDNAPRRRLGKTREDASPCLVCRRGGRGLRRRQACTPYRVTKGIVRETATLQNNSSQLTALRLGGGQSVHHISESAAREASRRRSILGVCYQVGLQNNTAVAAHVTGDGSKARTPHSEGDMANSRESQVHAPQS